MSRFWGKQIHFCRKSEMDGQLVFFENGNICFDTYMTQGSFAKSRMADHMEENGWLAQKDGGQWNFSEWRFTGTRARMSESGPVTETVILEGAGFAGRTLKDFFDLDFSRELGNAEKAFVIYAAAKTCSALEAASKQKIDVANIGGGGIYLSADFSKILFLPKTLFENAVESGGETNSSEQNGIYVNPTLHGSAAINFTQSVIAYRALTREFPFKSLKTNERLTDYFDRNYEPLRNRIWALDEKLSFFVDNALQRKSGLRKHGAGKARGSSLTEKIGGILSEDSDRKSSIDDGDFSLTFPMVSFYKELGLNEKGEIPAGGVLSPVIRKSNMSQEAFEENAFKEKSRFQSRLALKRWFRAKRTPITAVCAICLGLLVVGAMYFQGDSTNPTSKGLTSFETVEMFYSAVNNLDVSSMQGCSSGSKINEFADMVSTVYVAAKNRYAYNVKDQTVSPAKWMNFNFDGNYNMFGLTDFNINDSKGSVFFSGPLKNSHPKAVSEEDGRAVKDKDTRDYTVTYNLVFSDSEETLSVERRTDLVHLLFHKDRWIITAVQTSDDFVEHVDYRRFYADYLDTFEDREKNPVISANLLRPDYPWIPTNSEIQEAGVVLEQERERVAY